MGCIKSCVTLYKLCKIFLQLVFLTAKILETLALETILNQAISVSVQKKLITSRGDERDGSKHVD